QVYKCAFRPIVVCMTRLVPEGTSSSRRFREQGAGLQGEPQYRAANPGAGPAALPPGLARSATGWQALTGRRGQRVMGVKPGRRATFFPVASAGVEVRKNHTGSFLAFS